MGARAVAVDALHLAEGLVGAEHEQRLGRTTDANARVAELADDPETITGAPDADPVEPARLAAVSFDFDALDRLVAAADERTRGVRRLLDRIARGEKPIPPGDGADGPAPEGA